MGWVGCPSEGKQSWKQRKPRTSIDSPQKPICGLIDPVSYGITPGSGPSHLALFGYDPFRYEIGRGVMEALGIDIPLTGDDLGSQGQFCDP